MSAYSQLIPFSFPFGVDYTDYALVCIICNCRSTTYMLVSTSNKNEARLSALCSLQCFVG